jgi:outer membrane lipoprotein-sorting protein
MKAAAAAAALAMLLLLSLSGCADHEKESIPTYPLMDAQSSLRVLVERAQKVQTVSGEGLISLTRPNGESIRLDAALAMQPPDNARLRAWKFGRAIFDLTVTPTGVYAISPDDPARKEQIRSAGISAAKLAKTWSILSGGFFNQPALKSELHGDRLLLRAEAAGEPVVVCDVDRRTLTPRRYALLDDKGNERFSLTLDRYRQFNEIVWPMRLAAVSESGTVKVEMRDVEINPELPPGAFVPPRRAEKLP